MRTWKLFEVGETAIRLHPTFLLLLLWVVVVRRLEGAREWAVAGEVAFVLLLFGCVVLHELAHVLVGRRFGVHTREITILPIGGLARMDRIPRKPDQEFAIALAGPATNLLIAALLALVVGTQALGAPDPTQLPILARLMLFNVVLAGFNLLPAFPMDGGRLLRALLALFLSYSRATSIAAGLGQLVAAGLALLGLLGNPFLVLLALFVWVGAGQEAQLVQIQNALEGLPVAGWMATQVVALDPGQPLAVPLKVLLSSYQRDFPVLQEGRLVGLLTRSDLLRSLLSAGPATPVAQAMRAAACVDAEQTLDQAFEQLATCEAPALPVLQQGRLVGMVTAENLAELVLLRGALGQRGALGWSDWQWREGDTHAQSR